VAAVVVILLAPPRTLEIELPLPRNVAAPVAPVPRRSHEARAGSPWNRANGIEFPAPGEIHRQVLDP
jgi:hypothetical protein